jgi:hypothetical protein
MAFGLAIYHDQVGLDPAIWRQDDWAIAHALAGLDSFGKIYFAGLSARSVGLLPVLAEWETRDAD